MGLPYMSTTDGVPDCIQDIWTIVELHWVEAVLIRSRRGKGIGRRWKVYH